MDKLKISDMQIWHLPDVRVHLVKFFFELADCSSDESYSDRLLKSLSGLQFEDVVEFFKFLVLATQNLYLVHILN